MQERIDVILAEIKAAFSKPVDPNDPEVQRINAFVERAKANTARRKIEPDASPEERFNGLVRNLKESMEGRIITAIDSDAAKLFSHLQEHPELSSSEEELGMRLDILNGLVAAAWKAPNWEDSLARLVNPRLNKSF